jgi:Protein of unknown function (DUF1573)
MSRFYQFLSLAAALVILLPGQVRSESAKIFVKNLDIHFGTVAQGEKVTQVFPFTNNGDAPLQIERVKSSCGCTAALLSSKELAPGESGEVRATFDSTRFQGMVAKTIYLYTNDPLHKVVQLHLRGDVKPEISLVPGRLALGPVEPGQGTSGQLTITNESDKEIVVEQVVATAREIQVDFQRRVLQPKEQAEIPLQVKVPAEKGSFSAYLLLKFSGTAISEQRVPVVVKVIQ